jgi:UDP-N-acetylglucosamine 2-epimerase
MLDPDYKILVLFGTRPEAIKLAAVFLDLNMVVFG